MEVIVAVGVRGNDSD